MDFKIEKKKCFRVQNLKYDTIFKLNNIESLFYRVYIILQHLNMSYGEGVWGSGS